MKWPQNKTLDLYDNLGVMSHRETLARQEIAYELYTNLIRIESRVIGDLAKNHILPTTLRYQNELIKNVQGLKDILDAKDFKDLSSIQMDMIKKISKHVKVVQEATDKMIAERKRINKLEDPKQKANEYSDIVKPYFDKIRYSVDKLELMVDDEMWPLPKYRELLFNH